MALLSAGSSIPFLPNLKEGMTCRLEAQTDIMRARDGTEERRILRPAPRLTLGYGTLLTANDAAFMDNIFWRHAASEFLVPFWPFAARLTATATAGSGSVPVITANLPIEVGGKMLLTNGDGRLCEEVEIDAIASDAIGLVDTLDATWGTGTYLVPSSIAVLTNDFEVSVDSLTSSVHKSSLEMLYRQDLPPVSLVEGSGTTAYGVEVWLTPPNWREKIPRALTGFSNLVDFSLGKFSIPDREELTTVSPSRSFKGTWFLKGRDKIVEMFQFCLRRKGRAIRFAMPSWTDDFRLLSNSLTGATTLLTSYNYTETPPIPDRSRIYVERKNGSYVVLQIASVTDNGNGTQTLTLTGALGQDIYAADVRMISRLLFCRLASDTVEFEWPSFNFAEAKLSIQTLAEP